MGRVLFRFVTVDGPQVSLLRRSRRVSVTRKSERERANDQEWLAEQFESNRARLRSVAYRMLGSVSEAEDAVQESWLRLARSDSGRIENLSAWLTTVVARVCLNMLRARQAQREDRRGVRLPDPILTYPEAGADPERATLLVDSVSVALLVVLEALEPDARLAFVLHDMFGIPFDDIAPIVGRTPIATRQLASRARRRVQSYGKLPDRDLVRQRELVNAFLTAARTGDMAALIAILDPDVVARADRGAAPEALSELRGARAVAQGALAFSKLAQLARPALVNGTPGILSFDAHGKPFSVMAFTVCDGRIVEIDILTDPARLRRLNLANLTESEIADN